METNTHKEHAPVFEQSIFREISGDRIIIGAELTRNHGVTTVCQSPFNTAVAMVAVIVRSLAEEAKSHGLPALTIQSLILDMVDKALTDAGCKEPGAAGRSGAKEILGELIRHFDRIFGEEEDHAADDEG